MTRHLTLREWGYFPVCDAQLDTPYLLTEEADGLHNVAMRAQRDLRMGDGEGEAVLQRMRNRIRAQQVVGILATGDVSLEILPKIDNADDGSTRLVLVEMLAKVLDLPIASGRLSALSMQNRFILEIVIGLYCELAFDRVHRGLPRAYVAQVEDLPILKGRLDVVRQFSTLAASPQKLACRFDELSMDILSNRIVRTGIACAYRLSGAMANRRRLRILDDALDEVSMFARGEKIPFERLIFDRTNRQLKDLISLSRLLIEGSYQTTSGGAGAGFALLFEMNTLFEEFIGILTRKAGRRSGSKVFLQGPRSYVLNTPDGRRLFATKPDIYWKGIEGEVIIDTKWKRLDATNSGGRWGVSQSDIYQMMAYAHVYPANRLILLYPHHSDLHRPAGLQAVFNIENTQKSIEIATVDMTRPATACDQIEVLVRSLSNQPIRQVEHIA